MVTVARDIDIFSMHSENNYIGISIIVVRKGKIRGTKTHLVKKLFLNLLILCIKWQLLIL